MADAAAPNDLASGWAVPHIDAVDNDRTVRVAEVADLRSALERLGVRRDRPVLVLVGGAGGMTLGHMDLFRDLLADLLPVLVDRGVAVVDGGTDSGVMKVMGGLKGELTLVGVAAEGTLGDVSLENNHVHVLVPGSEWGDESPWIAEVASVIAGMWPSVTLLVNGGEIAYSDVAESIERQRTVFVLEGTGRTADAIAAASGDRAASVASSPFTQVVDAAGIVPALAHAFDTAG